MKIVREGHVPRYWPYEDTWECRRCHCEFEVDEGDPVTISPVTDPNKNAVEVATITCPTPTCGETVERYRF